MAPADAEWIRAHAWTQTMRRHHRSMPDGDASCACQFGTSQHCQRDACGECQRGTAHTSPETYITTGRCEVLTLPQEYIHPTLSATGPHYVGHAMVWLADRVCRWVCPHECHARGGQVDAGARAGQAPRPAEPGDVLSLVISRADGRCQCETCPPHRRSPGGRCETERSVARLIAAPAHPGAGPEREPVITDPARLRAWCVPCYDQAVKRARKYARGLALAAAGDMDALF